MESKHKETLYRQEIAMLQEKVLDMKNTLTKQRDDYRQRMIQFQDEQKKKEYELLENVKKKRGENSLPSHIFVVSL